MTPHPDDLYAAGKWGPLRRAVWRWRRFPKHRNPVTEFLVTIAWLLAGVGAIIALGLLAGVFINATG